MITAAEIAEARLLCEKATPGPITNDHGEVYDRSFTTVGKFGTDEDANFFVMARTLLPRLLDALAEERERGAGIAEAWPCGCAKRNAPAGHHWPECETGVGQDIAGAIRSGAAAGGE